MLKNKKNEFRVTTIVFILLTIISTLYGCSKDPGFHRDLLGHWEGGYHMPFIGSTNHKFKLTSKAFIFDGGQEFLITEIRDQSSSPEAKKKIYDFTVKSEQDGKEYIITIEKYPHKVKIAIFNSILFDIEKVR